MSRALGRVALVLALTGVLAGCKVRVGPEVTVNGDQVAVTATVTADGVAADKLSEDANRTQLVNLLAKRTGVDPATVTVDQSEGHLKVTATTDYDHVAAASGVSGVSALSMTSDGDRRTVTAQLVAPVELDTVLAQSVAGHADSAGMTAAMRGGTETGVTVRFAGGAVSNTFTPDGGHSQPADGPQTTDEAVEFYQPVSHFVPGTLVVTGNAYPVGNGWQLPVLVAAGAGALIYAVRRDRTRRATSAES